MLLFSTANSLKTTHNYSSLNSDHTKSAGLQSAHNSCVNWEYIHNMALAFEYALGKDEHRFDDSLIGGGDEERDVWVLAVHVQSALQLSVRRYYVHVRILKVGCRGCNGKQFYIQVAR